MSFTFHFILFCIDVYHVHFHSTNITNIHVYKNTTNLQRLLQMTSFFIKSISKILHNSHCTDAIFFQIFSQFLKLVLLISLSLVDKLLTSSRYHVDFDCSTVTIALLVACSNMIDSMCPNDKYMASYLCPGLFSSDCSNPVNTCF